MSHKLVGTFKFDGTEYEVRATNDYATRSQKTKVYVDEMRYRDPHVEFKALADHLGAPTVYTSKGDYPAIDKAFRKMNKEIVADKTLLLERARELGLLEFSEAKFSRKGGCSCGCSPAFRATDFKCLNVSNATDVWVSKVVGEKA